MCEYAYYEACEAFMRSDEREIDYGFVVVTEGLSEPNSKAVNSREVCTEPTDT